MAALALPSAMVCVAPPLLASAPRAMPAAAATVALAPQELSSARLARLFDAGVPAQLAPLAPLTRSVFLSMGEPLVARLAPVGALLPARVLPRIVSAPLSWIAPPLVVALLLATVLPSMLRVSWLASAPPWAALPPLSVLRLMVVVPRLSTAPPLPPLAFPLRSVAWLSVSMPPVATWKRRKSGVPAALLRSMTAPCALIVTGLAITGRPLAP